MGIQDKINHAIQEFEKYNNFKLENYNSTPVGIPGVYTDPRIGNDVFAGKVEEWLKMGTEEEEKILLKLLCKFHYYPENIYIYNLYCMLQNIKSDICKGNATDYVFIAVPPKKGGVGGATHIYSAVSTIFSEYGIKGRIFENYKQAPGLLKKKINECKYIVLVDDISGSGNSIKKTLIDICDNYVVRDDIKIIVHIMCATNEVLLYLQNYFQDNYKVDISFNVHQIINKCIHSDYGVITYEEGEIIKKLEEHIKETDDCVYNYDTVLGYDGSELLVSFHYNTPNNTLSSFWRPSEINIPLFVRADRVRKRPNLDEIQRNKKIIEYQAYRRGSIK